MVKYGDQITLTLRTSKKLKGQLLYDVPSVMRDLFTTSWSGYLMVHKFKWSPMDFMLYYIPK